MPAPNVVTCAPNRSKGSARQTVAIAQPCSQRGIDRAGADGARDGPSVWLITRLSASAWLIRSLYRSCIVTYGSPHAPREGVPHAEREDYRENRWASQTRPTLRNKRH